MFDEDGAYVTDVKYIVTFIFEALNLDQDVEKIWGINPINDLTNI